MQRKIAQLDSDMKKITFIFSLVLFLGLVFLQTTLAKPALAIAQYAPPSPSLSPLQKNAELLLDKRIISLTTLYTRITTDIILTSDDKNIIETDIKKSIQDLSALKNTISNDSELQLKTDTAKIASLKIYAVFIPREELIIIIDDLGSLSSRTKLFTTQLTSLLDNTPSGVDKVKGKSILQDISTRLSAIDVSLKTDKILVENVTVESTNPLSVFNQIRIDLAKDRASFAKIRLDLAQFKALLAASTSTSNVAAASKTSPTTVASPTGNPTCIQRPKCLDAHPRCMIAEPVSGWCPTPIPSR